LRRKRNREGAVGVRQNRAQERATKGAWNTDTSEGSDTAITAYRPIFVNGRQTIQFANKKKISIQPFVASTDLHYGNNHLETKFVAGVHGC
jgi:hypothetical protein